MTNILLSLHVGGGYGLVLELLHVARFLPSLRAFFPKSEAFVWLSILNVEIYIHIYFISDIEYTKDCGSTIPKYLFNIWHYCTGHSPWTQQQG